jgi:HEAT repeat protein
MSFRSAQDLSFGVPAQDYSQEIANLLKELAPGTLAHHPDLWIGPPGSSTIERVRTRLLQIANESPSSRKSVITALITVLNNPKGDFDFDDVERWRIAVALLGELNAKEAIDDLVRNINWTSYNSVPHPPPPVRTALVRIGAPAVPRLLSLLPDPNEFTRLEASETLAEIGEPSLDGLLEILERAGPATRTAAAHALGLIGGARARNAIEKALSLETEIVVREELEYAVKQMDHMECVRDPSKCK